MNELKGLERREYWLQVIEGQKQSGLTKADYCSQNDIALHRFYYWQRTFNDNCTKAAGFARVEVVDEQESSGIKIKLRNGLQAELDSDFDSDALRRFLAVVS